MNGNLAPAEVAFGEELTNFEAFYAVAALQDDAGGLMAKDAVALHDERANAPRLPEVNVRSARLSVSRTFPRRLSPVGMVLLPADPGRLDVQEDLAGPGDVHWRFGHQYPMVRRHQERRVRVAREKGVILGGRLAVCHRVCHGCAAVHDENV